MTATRARVAVGVVVVYVAVAAATVRFTDHHVRPLFESIGPAPAYQWVDPPSQFAAGNVKPHAVTRALPLNAAGSGLTSVQSSDSQVVVNLPDGAVPPKPGDSALELGFTPLAPKQVAAPPGGLRADGNVYRVTLDYKPSGQTITTVAKPGNLVMAVPDPGVAILYSIDGKRWTKLTTQPVGGPTTLGTRFDRAGYYMGAANPTVTKKKSNTGAVVAVVAIVVVLALLLGLGPVLVRRLRRPKTRSEQRRQQRRR